MPAPHGLMPKLQGFDDSSAGTGPKISREHVRLGSDNERCAPTPRLLDRRANGHAAGVSSRLLRTLGSPADRGKVRRDRPVVMDPLKLFALKVAKRAWDPSLPFVVVEVPWDQFAVPSTVEAYGALVASSGAWPAIVSKSPAGAWSCVTSHEEEWRDLRLRSPLDSLDWQTMAFESKLYPWEAAEH